MAPGEGGAEVAVVGGAVGGGVGGEGEWVGQAGEQRHQIEGGDAGGGEFDRERQAVESGAEGGDGGGVARGEGEGRVGGLDAGDKEGDSRIRGQRLECGGIVGTRAGGDSGCTGWRRSARRRNATRLVASMTRSGQAARRSASRPVPPPNYSRLSSTRRRSRSHTALCRVM